MQQTIVVGETSGANSPVVRLYCIDSGWLVPAYRTKVELHDPQGNPVVAGNSPVGEFVSTGTYALGWTVPGNQPPGLYRLTWQWQPKANAPWRTTTERLLVLASAAERPPPGMYALVSVSDLRAEGVGQAHSDERLWHLIDRSSRWIERATRRQFVPYMASITGPTVGPLVELPASIIAIESVTDLRTGIGFERHELIVHSRFDGDQDYPRIERRPRFNWQSVGVVGLFGFTEPDGSALGRVPVDIVRAATLMVVRDLEPLISMSRLQSGDRVVLSETTRDQSVTYAAPSKVESSKPTGTKTGYPDIDAIISAYRMPHIGVAVV